MFDQQPIEAAAMADALRRAYTVTGDRTWGAASRSRPMVHRRHNDTGLPMYDDVSGGGFDGLQPEGVTSIKVPSQPLLGSPLGSEHVRSHFAMNCDRQVTESGTEMNLSRPRHHPLFVPGHEDVGPGDSRARRSSTEFSIG